MSTDQHDYENITAKSTPDGDHYDSEHRDSYELPVGIHVPDLGLTRDSYELTNEVQRPDEAYESLAPTATQERSVYESLG